MRCATSRKCIPMSWKCDSDSDCTENDIVDDSDELNCRKLEYNYTLTFYVDRIVHLYSHYASYATVEFNVPTVADRYDILLLQNVMFEKGVWQVNDILKWTIDACVYSLNTGYRKTTDAFDWLKNRTI